jgi:hypothetical protein
MIKEPTLAAALKPIDVPVKVDESTVVMDHQLILEPHAVFADVYHNARDSFRERFCGGSYDRVPQFWEAMSTHPSYASHPTLHARPDHRLRAIPVSLHGDGTPLRIY